MIRKQVYITSTHEADLKGEASATGLTEAEIIRAALDAAFGNVKGGSGIDTRILDAFIGAAREFRKREQPLGPNVFDRESIYRRFARRRM